jgi:hypothetical protein
MNVGTFLRYVIKILLQDSKLFTIRFKTLVKNFVIGSDHSKSISPVFFKKIISLEKEVFRRKQRLPKNILISQSLMAVEHTQHAIYLHVFL